jgi:hypothetical protein
MIAVPARARTGALNGTVLPGPKILTGEFLTDALVPGLNRNLREM